MENINKLVAAALLAFGAAAGPLLAQTQEQPAAQKDEAKMDPKGVPGSPSTQSGKDPADASAGSSASSASSGSSGSSSSSSGASGPGQTSAAKTPEEVTQSRDESKMDAKGIPGSPSTQSGAKPSGTQ